MLDTNIIHDINQGGSEVGIEAFKKFMDHMNDCYDENITDCVVMIDTSGKHVACTFTVNGVYLKTDGKFPAAKKQTYKLPATSVFELRDQKVARVTTYYNLPDWIKQVS